MLTNPIKLPLTGGTDVYVESLPLTGQGVDNAIYTSEEFRSGSGVQMLIGHTYGKRARHTIRANYAGSIPTGDFSARTASIYLVVDLPYDGFTLVKNSADHFPDDLLAGFVHLFPNGFATAVSGTTDPVALHASAASILKGES